MYLKTAAVINPAAAYGRVGKHLDALEDSLRGAFDADMFLKTARPGHAAELARSLVNDGYGCVLSVGGDGTHNEVVNGLFEGRKLINPDIVFGIVPYGTGSDLSRTLGVRRGRRGIEDILRATPASVDVGYVRYRLPEGGDAARCFINVADFGAGGEVVRRVNASTKFFGGFASFLYSVVVTGITYRSQFMRIELDKESIEGRFKNVIVANGAYYGGGMHVAPDARLDSGVFEVIAIGDVGIVEAAVNLPKLYRGRLLKKAGKVEHFTTSTIVARTEGRLLLNLDGEQPGALPATFEVLPSALKILRPGGGIFEGKRVA